MPRRLEAPRDLASAVHRIRCHLPLLTAAKLDSMFRCYLLTSLLDMHVAEGKSVPIPKEAVLDQIDSADYARL